ncbi:MAG: hypothetical protein IIC51_06855 [Planctomycetes bacterium]|nr:hypothetical protein [Planctomycetota bacterium]
MHVRLGENRYGRSEKRFDPSGLRIHMIGIGGCGMSGAGRILAERGAVLSGSDLNSFEGIGSLVQRGVRVSVGHRAEQVGEDVDLVVISAAIPSSNPELQMARRRGVRVIKYAELLGELSRGYQGIAIAGTHGKSTTTAMVAHIFREAGLDPTFVIGAQSEQLGGSSAAGTGPHFVVESCEFDRSFLHLRPHAAAILNIEPDHLDCYGEFAAIVAAFNTAPQQGHVVTIPIDVFPHHTQSVLGQQLKDASGTNILQGKGGPGGDALVVMTKCFGGTSVLTGPAQAVVEYRPWPAGGEGVGDASVSQNRPSFVP